MSISGIQSGYSIIQQSSKMAEEAAIELNQANQYLSDQSLEAAQQVAPEQASDAPISIDKSPEITPSNEALPADSGSLDFNQVPSPEFVKMAEPMPSHSDAMLKLTQSASYNRVGASVVERQNEAIGSLLDIHI